MQSDLTPKPRWLRDLMRFLPLRSQFVLSGNIRDLQIHEPAPSEVTAVPLVTILTDQLRKSGYERIVTFDPLAGFRSLHTPGTAAEQSDEVLRALGLMPSNATAPAGIDLLATTLERFVALDGSSRGERKHKRSQDLAALKTSGAGVRRWRGLMAINNCQCVGSLSNTQAGNDFESLARKFFARQGIELTKN